MVYLGAVSGSRGEGAMVSGTCAISPRPMTPILKTCSDMTAVYLGGWLGRQTRRNGRPAACYTDGTILDLDPAANLAMGIETPLASLSR